MKATARSRRDHIRAQLADLKMPGALEALDDVLTTVDGGSTSSMPPSGMRPELPRREKKEPRLSSSRVTSTGPWAVARGGWLGSVTRGVIHSTPPSREVASPSVSTVTPGAHWRATLAWGVLDGGERDREGQ